MFLFGKKPSEALVAEATNMNTAPERLEELGQQKPLQIFIAANPATPPAALSRLGTNKDKAIRGAVVQNPNTPLHTLSQLAAEFPGEFLRNPILPILNMTHPNFVKEFSINAWGSLLKFAAIPPFWLQQIQADKNYQRSRTAIWELIQLHTMTEIPAMWRQQVDSHLRKYRKSLSISDQPTSLDPLALFLLFILLFPTIAPMLKEEWLSAAYKLPGFTSMALAAGIPVGKKTMTQLSRGHDSTILRQVGRHPLTSTRALIRLAKHPDAAVRRTVASNPHTPVEQVLTLASDSDRTVRRSAVSHPGLTSQDYEILALDEDDTVRASLALLPRLPTDLYHKLAQDTSARVRAALARNAKTPQEILRQLAGDSIAEVRAAAASNPRLPTEVTEALLHDSSGRVRANLSGNARLPEHCYQQLAHDPSSMVRKYLAANPRTPVTLLAQLEQTGDMEVWDGLARHPQASPELLEKLAQQGNTRVQAAVAANKRAPTHILRLLAQGTERATWLALVTNPRTPLDVLEQAIKTLDIELWLRMKTHPALVQQQLRPFLTFLVSTIEELIATDALPNWVRRAVFQYSRALPATLLEPFADSPLWEDRYLAARHPRMTKELLEQLNQDGIVYVRAAAKETLERRGSA